MIFYWHKHSISYVYNEYMSVHNDVQAPVLLFCPRDTSLLDKSNPETMLPTSEMMHKTFCIRDLKKIPASWNLNCSLKWDASVLRQVICYYMTNMQEGRKADQAGGKFRNDRLTLRCKRVARMTLTVLSRPTWIPAHLSAAPGFWHTSPMAHYYRLLLVFRQCK